jgi:hypothetical protein
MVASTESRGPPGYVVIGLYFIEPQTIASIIMIVEKKDGMGQDMTTHARLPYASITIPCFAENSKTSFHDA